MLTYTQLNIIRSKLREVSESPYFSGELNLFLEKLSNTVDALFEKYDLIPEDIIRKCVFFITNATNFFTGSTTKKVPYEIVYCLENACGQWIDDKTIITTALSPSILGFYFQSVNKSFYEFSKEQLGIEFNYDLIQISLPEVYRRRPLCATPLYHELGHFIDANKGISEIAYLFFRQHGILPTIDANNNWKNTDERIWRHHCAEYFADLYSAQFIGKCGVDFLEKIAGSDLASATHPATSERVSVVNDFLSGKKNPVVDMFNFIINLMFKDGKILVPNLTQPAVSPDISISFDNIRPYSIKDRNEMHSFIDSGWSYLCNTWERPKGIWEGVEKKEIEKIVNDLVEKSIRNFMILNKWGSHVSS